MKRQESLIWVPHRKVLFIHSTKPQTFQLPKPTQSSQPRFYFPQPSPGLPTTTSPHFPGNTATPVKQIQSCVICTKFFFTAQFIFLSAGETEAEAKYTHCASGLAYLQLGHVLLVADLQWLPLVLLLLQLAVVVCQLFHQAGVLGT